MITIVDKIEEANCITHSGTMHADDVFATAFLHLYLKEVKLFRTSEVDMTKIQENALVYDIGRGEFDHHQLDAKKRNNDIPYSSIGLLWEKYGRDYLNRENFENAEEVKKAVDKDLIEGIDADDNGIFPKIETKPSYKVKTISNIIKLFNPGFESNQDENIQFLKAVAVAEKILEEEIVYIKGKVEANKKVKEILNNIDHNSKYLILESFIPYEDTIVNNEELNNILFVAFPSNRGGYAIKTVPKSSEDKTSRLPFPEEWAGLIGEKLEEVSGITGLRFCHNSRFIVNCENKEVVLQVLDKLCK